MIEDFRLVVASLKEAVRSNDGEIPYLGAALPASPAKSLSQGQYPRAGRKQEPSAPPLPASDGLSGILAEMGDCRLCSLGGTRKKLVFGVGDPKARVMFVGEGPGYEEDRQGEPFVGKAGQLLDKIMASIGLDRSKTYIANIVKCHPMVDPNQPDLRGNDRPPSPEEMATCLPFLRKQIERINPDIIITLGATATKALLNTFDGIARLRGKVREVEIIPGKPAFKILPTYHPAALLRNPELKKDVWQDMKQLREMLNSASTSIAPANTGKPGE